MIIKNSKLPFITIHFCLCQRIKVIVLGHRSENNNFYQNTKIYLSIEQCNEATREYLHNITQLVQISELLLSFEGNIVVENFRNLVAEFPAVHLGSGSHLTISVTLRGDTRSRVTSLQNFSSLKRSSSFSIVQEGASTFRYFDIPESALITRRN